MDGNPWDVQCLEEYLVYFFSCPECQELKQSEEEFLEHAIENHPNSKQSLLKFLVKDPNRPVEFEDLKRKVENMFSDESKNETPTENELKEEDEVNVSEFECDVDITEQPPIRDESDIDRTTACSRCKAPFYSIRYLKIHMKKCKRLKDETGKLVCNLCNKAFADAKGLKYHIDKDHENITYKCDLCEKILSSKQAHDNHMKYACEKVPHQPFVCDICGKSFKTPRSLKSHFESNHSESEMGFQCDKCEKQFKKQTSLKYHINIVHLGLKPEKNQSCPQCDYKCRSIVMLQNHIDSVHDGKKNYQCELCPMKFAWKNGLTGHIKNVHNKEKPFVCDTCGNSYFSKQSLHNHIDAVHKQLRKWNCEFCGKTYTQCEGLRVHVQTVHHGIRFSCFKCNKSFTQIQNLKKHVKESYGMSYQEYLDVKKHLKQ